MLTPSVDGSSTEISFKGGGMTASNVLGKDGCNHWNRYRVRKDFNDGEGGGGGGDIT